MGNIWPVADCVLLLTENETICTGQKVTRLLFNPFTDVTKVCNNQIVSNHKTSETCTLGRSGNVLLEYNVHVPRLCTKPSYECMIVQHHVCIINVDQILLDCEPDDWVSPTYEVQLQFWLHWLPAVETKVLDLISWVYQTPVTSRDVLLRRCRNLVSQTCVCFFSNF